MLFNMLHFIYVDTLTQRIFRAVPYDHRFVPAVLDGVLGMVMPMPEISKDKSLCWSRFRGVFRAETEVTPADGVRLDTLSDRCESLESLYKTIYLLRKHVTGQLPYDDLIFQERLREAHLFEKSGQVCSGGYLSDFCEEKSIEFSTGAKMMFLKEQDQFYSLKQSEKIRLQWERRFLVAENPKEEFEKFKNEIYLG